MDFRTALSQFEILLDQSITCYSEHAKPSNVFVNQDGSQIYISPGISRVQDEAILKIFLSKISKTLKKSFYHIKILNQVTQDSEAPLSEAACKVQRILTWGGVKPKYITPMLKLLRFPIIQVVYLLEHLENEWKKMESVLSWNQFLHLCKKMDKEKDICRAAYIALSFKAPNLTTLNKFRLYLKEYKVIEESANLIQMLAFRTSTAIKTIHEETALVDIWVNTPSVSTCYPLNGTFAADFKLETLYYSCDDKNPVFSSIYSPSHCLDGKIKSSIPDEWPRLNQTAFQQLIQKDYHQEVINFTELPDHLKKDGIRLIRTAQQKGYLSKGNKLSDFTRIDLMALYFLFHSNELDPRERYIVEKGATFSLIGRDPLEEMGNAVRAYIEHDFPYLSFLFVTAIENGQIFYWEKKNAEETELKKLDLIDPLTLLMKDLLRSVEWVETLFFNEKVQGLIKHGD
jgi:hypothetical protein